MKLGSVHITEAFEPDIAWYIFSVQYVMVGFCWSEEKEKVRGFKDLNLRFSSKG